MTTASEAMNSVNGFDEIAVEKYFGLDLYSEDQVRSKPVMVQRAVTFIDLRKNGATDQEAYDRAMNMPVGELGEYFEPEPDEVLPEEPDSEPGKG